VVSSMAMAQEEPSFLHTNGDRKSSKGKGNKPLKIKNTFIDVEPGNEDIDGEGDGLGDGFKKRQCSEPAPAVGGALGAKNRYSPAFGSFGDRDFNVAYAGDAGKGDDLVLPNKAKGQGGYGHAGNLPLLGNLDDDVLAASLAAVGLPTEELDSLRVAAAAAMVADLDADEKDQFAQDLQTLPPQMACMSPPPADWANTTTVMMRNIPNKYTQRMLLTEINHNGFLGTFDFLYLPIDPETTANRGYAFLNFIDPGFAWMFKVTYEGRKMNRFNSNKVVQVMPATLQGFEANYAHYSSARVNRGDPAARPLFLREPKGIPTEFVPGQARSRGGGRARRHGGHSTLDQLAAQQATHDNSGLSANFDAHMFQTAAAQSVAIAPPWGFGGGVDDMKFFGFDGSGFEGDYSNGAMSASHPPSQGPPAAPAKAGSTSASGVPKFCPYCGSPIQPGFQFCPNCGGSLDFAGGRPVHG